MSRLTLHGRDCFGRWPDVPEQLHRLEQQAIASYRPFCSDGCSWFRKRLPACANPTCDPCRLASYTPDIAACAEELAGHMDEAARSGQAIDFYQHAGRVAMDMTGATVFGCARWLAAHA